MNMKGKIKIRATVTIELDMEAAERMGVEIAEADDNAAIGRLRDMISGNLLPGIESIREIKVERL